MARRRALLLVAVGLARLAVCYAAPGGAPALTRPATAPAGPSTPPSVHAAELLRPLPGDTKAGTVPLVSGTVSGAYVLARFPSVNVFEPGYGFVPSGFGNAPDGTNSPSNVPIQAWPAGGEFGLSDGSFLYVANADDSGLTITVTSFSGNTLLAATQTFVFSDTFPASAVTLVSNNFPSSNWVAGPSSVTFAYPDTQFTPGVTWTAVFNIGGSVSCAGAPLPPPVLNAAGWLASCTSTASGGVSCPATCNSGYRSVPVPTIRCGYDGTWIKPASGSQCIRACETNPPPLVGGSWDCAGTPVRGRCLGSCNSGLAGAPFRECGAGGWGPQVGKCVATPACIGLPTAIVPNGAWPLSCYDSTAGSSCTATCNTNYVGTATVTCQGPPTALAGTGGAAWSTTVTGACRRP